MDYYTSTIALDLKKINQNANYQKYLIVSMLDINP